MQGRDSLRLIFRLMVHKQGRDDTVFVLDGEIISWMIVNIKNYVTIREAVMLLSAEQIK